MAKGDMVEKKRLNVDGNDLEGVIEVGEYVIEDTVVNVPGRKKTVPVRNGVKIIPAVPARFKITRNSKTYTLLKDWYEKNETKDVTCIRVDSAGQEFARELWPNTEIAKFHSGAYAASAPDTAQIITTFLPEDIINIASQ